MSPCFLIINDIHGFCTAFSVPVPHNLRHYIYLITSRKEWGISVLDGIDFLDFFLSTPVSQHQPKPTKTKTEIIKIN